MGAATPRRLPTPRRQRRARHRRQRRCRRDGGDLPVRRRQPAAGGRARGGQDDARPRARSFDRRRVHPRPGHARPAAERPDRHQRLRPAARRVPVRARAGVRQRRAGGRDQPHDAAHAVGAARADGGAPGHGRGHDLPAARALRRDRDREPHRAARHVPAARGPARPVRDGGAGRLSRRRSGRRHRAPPVAASIRCTSCAPCSRPRRCWHAQRAVRSVHVDDAIVDYVRGDRGGDPRGARGRARRVAALDRVAHAVRAGARRRARTRPRAARRREGPRLGRARAPHGRPPGARGRRGRATGRRPRARRGARAAARTRAGRGRA